MKKIIKIFILTTVALLFAIGTDMYLKIGSAPSEDELLSYKNLPYFKDGKFVSLLPITYEPEKVRNGPAGMLRFFSKSKFAPNHELKKAMLDKNSFAKTPENFALYWLGHSSAIMDFKQKRLIFDPVLGNAAPLFFAAPRFDKAPIKRKDLPQTDIVIITHNHYDHMEKQSIIALKNSHFIVPLGVKNTLVNWGVKKENITQLGWRDSYKTDDIIITAFEGVHYSGRTRADKNKTLWNSYMIESNGFKVFWGGDSGYSNHYKKIGDEFGPFDFAALEIDGWNPAWKRTHLFPDEVVKATLDLKAKVLLPIHWGVFDLALHPWHESIDMVIDEAKGKNIDIKTPMMGEKIYLNSKTTKWW